MGRLHSSVQRETDEGFVGAYYATGRLLSLNYHACLSLHLINFPKGILNSVVVVGTGGDIAASGCIEQSVKTVTGGGGDAVSNGGKRQRYHWIIPIIETSFIVKLVNIFLGLLRCKDC